jgi:hypothetical protein
VVRAAHLRSLLRNEGSLPGETAGDDYAGGPAASAEWHPLTSVQTPKVRRRRNCLRKPESHRFILLAAATL